MSFLPAMSITAGEREGHTPQRQDGEDSGDGIRDGVDVEPGPLRDLPRKELKVNGVDTLEDQSLEVMEPEDNIPLKEVDPMGGTRQKRKGLEQSEDNKTRRRQEPQVNETELSAMLKRERENYNLSFLNEQFTVK